MPRSDGTLLLLMLAAGMLLGTAYYGGLWLTILAAKKSKSPLKLFGGSFFVRAALTGGAFYLIARSGVTGTVTALAGLLLARTVLIRWIRRPKCEVSDVGNNP